MAVCDECGSDNVDSVRLEGHLVQECGLCGALAGDDRAVTAVLLAREAREKGIDPAIYPLVRTLDRIAGLKVLTSDPGDPGALTWPFVQLAVIGPEALVGVESLVKSLALSGRTGSGYAGHEVHWVVEMEYRHRLVLTLKPRFHRDIGRITAEVVLAARADLQRVQRNLQRDMGLSWWQ